MINVAIIDDEPSCSEHLISLLERYSKEMNVLFSTHVFPSAEAFLDNYKPVYDLVFMDIDLPGDNGIKATRKLREYDSKVILYFATYLAQFAIEGYKVNAKDYFVKPIKYYDLKMDLDQACPLIEKDTDQGALNISVNNGVRRIPLSDIRYIETKGHTLIYHLRDDALEARGNSLKSMERKLATYGFACCHTSYLVNLDYCQSIAGDALFVGSDEIKITRTKKKEFVKRLADYFSKNGISDGRK